MSTTAVVARRRVLGALTVAGMAAITITPVLATPGAAMAATARPQAASVPMTAKYKSFPITFQHRTITLWFNWNTAEWHAEISDAATGDQIQLQYNDLGKDPGASTVGVASDESVANTTDFDFGYGENYRACGIVGHYPPACTGWEYSPYGG